MSAELVNQARSFQDYYDRQPVLVTKGDAFSQRDALELYDKYWRSEFLRGDMDDDGLYRFFYNVVKFPCRISTHKTDFDTKDVRAIAEDGQSYLPVYLLNKELKAWMKEQNIGEKLNELSSKLPRYGNVVFKTANGKVSVVNIKNLSNDPYVPSLHDSYMVKERHYMTPKQLKDQKEWDQGIIDSLLEELSRQSSKSRITVDEIYIYGTKSYFGGSKAKDDTLTRGVVIIANLDLYEKDDHGKIVKDYSKVLYKAEADLPYYEFFWEEFDGTWLRESVIRELLDSQMRINEVVNLQGKGFHWTNKKIFQTKDMGVARNLFYGVRNGDILRVNSEITPVVNEERNLPAFREDMRLWEDNMRRHSFSFESISGESLPSGTPFRLGFIQQQAAGGYFDQKRENIGLMLKKLIVDVIIPSFQKSSRRKHIFNLYGEDSELSTIEGLFVEFALYKNIEKFYQTTGIIPTEEEVTQERERALAKIRSRSFRELDIPDDFYENLKYKVDIVITNESVAMDSKIQTLTTILQTLGTNPMILQDETMKRVFFKILDFSGINPEELRVASTKAQIPLEMLQRFSPPPGGGGLKPELQTGATQLAL